MRRKEKPTRWKSGALLAGLGLGTAATLWGVQQWRRLKQTPPVSPRSHHAGLAGYFQQVGEWRMFTRVTPNDAPGLPLVLVHGLVMSGRAMEELALALGNNYRVLVPDLPGFGASTLPPSAPTLSVDEQADALWEWLQHNQLSRAIWIGNSFGCQILAALAVRHPDAVAGLVLQGPTVDRHARSLVRQAWRDWRNGRLERHRSPASLARIDYAKAGLWRALKTMRMMMHDRIEQRLAYVNAPTLLLRGSRDSVSPARWVEELGALLSRGEIMTLRGGTHTLHYVYPWSFCHAIRPFLARIQQENQHE
ncbi:alpha/beta hydrolase [Pantoea sp. ACRSB]|uniref:alpha/beta fold hydrolase n=1 Tax=Pantoea sp. ACRSB TaxID=2918207 RepID=UPI0028933012|nr:alpha/beta hydrolase [Pantoea sp. ACRSB]MCG7390228.1 alpha/beta hydrolase [Pantoea sp. ACRSB]